jgi:hypothetical protein
VLENFYLSILGRASDSGGKTFYLSEIERLFGLEVDRRESLRLIAKNFLASAEYAARGRTDAQYVDDLYRTFYQRDPDTDGQNFWLGQMANGLNRDAVLLGFMFSPEFQSFMDSAIGIYNQRPETALTMDGYRGAFSRLPDSGGLSYWRGTIRTGQCNGNTYGASDELVSTYFNGAEYANRGRNNRQFMADLYDVLFRRSPDVGGFNWWTSQIDTNAMTRQDVLNSFFGSAEWQQRIGQIAAAGCVQ